MSNFWISLELPLINSKVELSLTWNPNSVQCNLVGDWTFTIPDAKFCVRVVTLSTEDNTKLSKLLSKRFNRPVHWNKYNVIPNKTYDRNADIRELLDASYQGVKRLFVLTYRDAGQFSQKILPSKSKNWKLQHWNWWKNFFDQPINGSVK